MRGKYTNFINPMHTKTILLILMIFFSIIGFGLGKVKCYAPAIVDYHTVAVGEKH